MGFEGFRACIKARRFKLRCLARPVATKQGDSLACCILYIPVALNPKGFRGSA